jgi:hypothetical protein
MGRGLDKWTFTVQAFVALASDIGAQVKLDAFLAPSGSQSVKAAIEADGTLGGIVADTSVVSCTGYRVYARDGRRARCSVPNGKSTYSQAESREEHE